MLKGFKQFILRGNVVDLAVGVVIGASFQTVVSALVKGFITPLIGAIVKVPDFSALTFTVNGSQFLYGEFINALISFLLAALTIYFFVVVPINSLVHRVNRKEEEHPDPTTKMCPECLSEVPLKAKRCKFCTAVIA